MSGSPNNTERKRNHDTTGAIAAATGTRSIASGVSESLAVDTCGRALSAGAFNPSGPAVRPGVSIRLRELPGERCVVSRAGGGEPGPAFPLAQHGGSIRRFRSRARYGNRAFL